MKIRDKTDKTVTIEMTHEQVLMIVALVRESCFGTPMHGFDIRVGYPPETVGEIASELNNLLHEVGVSE